MAKNLNVLVFVLLVVANLLHGSLAQTRHVVGDTTGWTLPNNGASFYVNWASKNTFTVGDTIVFNFPTGQHDVAKVTKSAFDGCNGASPISMLTNGPATVTLNETGQQYFICTVGPHCSLGQKVSINVVKASTSPVSAPKPSASSPPKQAPVQAPTPTPTPTPATTKTASPAPAPTSSRSPATSPSPSASPPSPAAGATPPSSSASPPTSSTVSPSSQTSGGSASPPPENSGAASLGVAGLFVAILSVAASFFC